jgi:hypothetical protein
MPADNTITIYGRTLAARISDNSSAIFRWLPEWACYRLFQQALVEAG